MPERSDAVAAGLFDSDHWQSGIELFVIADMNLRSGGKADRPRQAGSQACNPEPLKRNSMGRMVVHRAFAGLSTVAAGVQRLNKGAPAELQTMPHQLPEPTSGGSFGFMRLRI